MNSNQAKQISIEKFLNSRGIKPVRKYNNYLYYHSPFRTDKKPSFRVDTNKNLWFDIGRNQGGKIIDLVCFMFRVNVTIALQILSNETNIKSFSFSPSKSVNNIQNNIKIKHIQSVQNKALIQYLNNRKISLKYANKHISEAYYKVKNKQYFSIAFKNDKGGYELRNKYFKGGTNPKHFTTIKIQNSTSINIFEGFFDFLSALQYFKAKQPHNTTIILNSITFIKQTLAIIKDYSKVNLFLDNDNAGTNAVEFYKEHHSNIINQSLRIYPKHKDFNEFLTS